MRVGSDRAVAAVERGASGAPVGDNRRVVEGIVYRYRTGMPWRDLPGEFGPWQTVWKRHRRYAADGTWDRVLARIVAEADAAGKVDWRVSVDATITRAHQHATNTTPPRAGHRGLARTTRICRSRSVNLQVTALAAPGAG